MKRSSPYVDARTARRGARGGFGHGAVPPRVAPIASVPFERFVLDVDGVRLSGTNLAQLHYVRELA